MKKIIWSRFKLYFIVGIILTLSAYIGHMVYEISSLNKTNAELVIENTSLTQQLAGKDKALKASRNEVNSLQQIISALAIVEEDIRGDFTTINERWQTLKNEKTCKNTMGDDAPIDNSFAGEWLLIEQAYCTAAGDCPDSATKAPDSSATAR